MDTTTPPLPVTLTLTTDDAKRLVDAAGLLRTAARIFSDPGNKADADASAAAMLALAGRIYSLDGALERVAAAFGSDARLAEYTPTPGSD